jgi:hypothetical protein
MLLLLGTPLLLPPAWRAAARWQLTVPLRAADVARWRVQTAAA